MYSGQTLVYSEYQWAFGIRGQLRVRVSIVRLIPASLASARCRAFVSEASALRTRSSARVTGTRNEPISFRCSTARSREPFPARRTTRRPAGTGMATLVAGRIPASADQDVAGLLERWRRRRAPPGGLSVE